MSHPQSAGLGRTGTGTSACDHTYPAWYAARRTCCNNAALFGGMFSIVRELCANNSFLLHWLKTFCCTLQLGTILSSLGSQSSRLQAAEIDRGRHLLRMDKISRLTMLTFPMAEEARHSVAPIDSKEEHLCFFNDILNNLVDSNMSKVSTDAKANPLQGQPHLCPRFGLPIREVIVVHNAQRGAECAYLPPRGTMVGDTRHHSCHFVWRRSFHPLC